MARDDRSVDNLIEMLYQKIEEAPPLTLNRNMCKVDRNQVLDLVDELKENLPAELKSARELLERRNQIVEDAKRDAERIRSKAEQLANKRVAESEVMRNANEKAQQIVSQAEARANQLLQLAHSYADDVLGRTEEAVQAALDEVKQNRVRFRELSNNQLREQREQLNAKNPIRDSE